MSKDVGSISPELLERIKDLNHKCQDAAGQAALIHNALQVADDKYRHSTVIHPKFYIWDTDQNIEFAMIDSMLWSQRRIIETLSKASSLLIDIENNCDEKTGAEEKSTAQ